MPFAVASDASAEARKPFKDELFSSQPVLESHDGGAFETIDYQKARDLNGRDEIPEKRAKRAYLLLGGRKVDVTRVGPQTGQAFTVIFVHGRGGDRRLGSDDYRFGGNFNRLKNLAVDNGGTYYAPSVKSFDDAGTADVAALVAHAYEQSGGRPVVLSCASMGSFICWAIADCDSHCSWMRSTFGSWMSHENW